MAETNAQHPFDMDSSSFDAEKYLERLLKVGITTPQREPYVMVISHDFPDFRTVPCGKSWTRKRLW